MALIVYNKENSRPQEVHIQGQADHQSGQQGNCLSIKDDVN